MDLTEKDEMTLRHLFTVACVGGALLPLVPLVGSITIGLAIGIGINRYLKKWRFNQIELAHKYTIIDDRDWACPTRVHVMYVGATDTTRWWYNPAGWLMPQAIDNGQFYWGKRVKIFNNKLREHLDGFWEMGNEWPEYYKVTHKPTVEQESKNKSKHKSDIVARPETEEEVQARQQIGARNVTTVLGADVPLINGLIDTVADLEKEIQGRCPRLEISSSED